MKYHDAKDLYIINPNLEDIMYYPRYLKKHNKANKDNDDIYVTMFKIKQKVYAYLYENNLLNKDCIYVMKYDDESCKDGIRICLDLKKLLMGNDQLYVSLRSLFSNKNKPIFDQMFGMCSPLSLIKI